MKWLFVSVLSAVTAVSVLVSGCTQAAPVSSPTSPPAAPTKAAPPTSVPVPAVVNTPQPTAAPAKTVEFPEKNRPITMIVPISPGGSTDISARILAEQMGKELGVPVQVVNKVGAASQVGCTELVNSKPDGYTIGMISIPNAVMTYLDPERKATYTGKDFLPVASMFTEPMGLGVSTSSPYKTAKDLVDAAKANPGKVKIATSGLGGAGHLPGLLWGQATGVKFSFVHFDGGNPATLAALAGHTDASISGAGTMVTHVKNETLRVLATLGKKESPLLPGVKTLEGLGWNVVGTAGAGVVVPAGTSKEVVAVLDSAVKKAMSSAELKQKMANVLVDLEYLGPAEYAAFWAETERWVQPLVKLVNQD